MVEIGRQGNLVVHRLVNSKKEPDGYLAWIHCPGCDDTHAYRFGGEAKPQWIYNGDKDRPSFTPSLRVRLPSTVCHLHLTNGELIFLGDCTHKLAGQTVPLPEPPDWLN